MKQDLEQAIAAVCKDLFSADVAIELSRPDEQFGDYATNAALQLAKQLSKNPREVAEAIRASLKHESILSVEIAGPGFLNLTLTDQALVAATKSQATKALEGQTVVIETNNPNPFKAMHIGHAFNAILADTIANLIEVGGAHVYRVSYHGDVGSHVGKSMYSLLKFVAGDPKKLDSISKDERNSFMSKMYAEGAAAYKNDADAKAEIDELAKQSFTREDPTYYAVYETCKDWSFEEIDQIVARIGNTPIERRFLESDADARGVPIVKANVPAVFQESDGALIFKGSEYGSFDNVYVSARGLGLYGARDMGLMKLKEEYFHPNKSYIVTAEEQRAYFKGVIAAAKLCMPEMTGVTVNISTGTVKLTTGKMSSRTGDVIEIAWLFDQIAEAIKANGNQATDEIIAGALRYQFLKVRVGSDVVFDINEAVSLQGNSGSYLQYAHARARSVLNKASNSVVPGSDPESSQKKSSLLLDSPIELGNDKTLEPGERSLVRKISEYSEAVDKAVYDLMPHHVCTYLYELAQVFNSFYEHNRVIGDPRQDIRLQLVTLYANTLKNGLELLNIPALEKM